MSCNDQNTDCAPCQDCTASPDPVMPRCDIALVDGTFTNSTVVVVNGCIIEVQQGEPPLYEPDPCCVAPANGGGGVQEPCDCPPGEDGENATISIGQIFAVAPTAPAQVINVGTPSNAVLEFYIPRGEDGADAPSGNGVTNNTAGINIVNGLVKALPAAWPPVLFITTEVHPNNVTFTASLPDPATGESHIVLDLQTFEADLKAYTDSQVAAAQATLQSQIDSLTTQLTALQTQVNACCP